MNVTAIIRDTIARFRLIFTFLRVIDHQVTRPDRRLAVAAGNVEHVVRLT